MPAAFLVKNMRVSLILSFFFVFFSLFVFRVFFFLQAGDVLCYSQPFRLRVNDTLKPELTLYLTSQPVTPTVSSRVTKHCEVGA